MEEEEEEEEVSLPSLSFSPHGDEKCHLLMNQ